MVKYLLMPDFPFAVHAVPVTRTTSVELFDFVVSVSSTPKLPKETFPLDDPVFLVAFTVPTTYDVGANADGLASDILPALPKST